MAYTTIDNPELFMQAKIFTGTGSSNAVTLDGDENMQPDMVWIKHRTATYNHVLTDAVRGVTKEIYPNTNGSEVTNANGLTAFGSDGFTVGSDAGYNASSGAIVAWCWKANGSGSSDTTGTINSTGTSANTTAGFSIVKYSSGGGSGTVGHGLGSVPKVMFYKPLSTSGGWDIYHHSLGIGNRLNLHNTAASSSGYFQTLPTSSVFTEPNLYSGQDVLMYCFAEKQGYSKFGKYQGNANVDGPFVYTGFRTNFIMIRRVDGIGYWVMHDNKRNSYNEEGKILGANATDAEYGQLYVDILSNGFKIRGGNAQSDHNTSSPYIYMAFAEAPFVNSNGVPCNAR